MHLPELPSQCHPELYPVHACYMPESTPSKAHMSKTGPHDSDSVYFICQTYIVKRILYAAATPLSAPPISHSRTTADNHMGWSSDLVSWVGQNINSSPQKQTKRQKQPQGMCHHGDATHWVGYMLPTQQPGSALDQVVLPMPVQAASTATATGTQWTQSGSCWCKALVVHCCCCCLALHRAL
jgi:hypothetical protein